MKNKTHIKISKELIWDIIKHLIGIVILYVLYLKFMPFGHTITITEEPFLEFIAQLFIFSLIAISIYMILVQTVGGIIKWLMTRLPEEHPFFDSIPLFKIYIPIKKEDLEKFDKKFKRKMIKNPEGIKEKEWKRSFCDRIIKEAIKEKLKRGR